MTRKSKVVLLSAAQVMEIRQKAELEVIYENLKLEIAETQNRHRVRKDLLDRLVSSAAVTVKDVVGIKDGQLAVKDIKKLPDHVARAIKKIKIYKDKHGNSTTEVELAHHLEYDEKIGKYLGIFQPSNIHLHKHDQAPPQIGDGKIAQVELSELSPEQRKQRRALLEKEVEALDVRTA